MLGAARHVDLGVADNARERARLEGTGMARGGNVGIVQHGVTVPAQPAVMARLRLGQHRDEAIALLGRELSGGAQAQPRGDPPQPKVEPLEELVLELTDLKFHEQDGARRASARARLVYEPATAGQPEVASAQSWRLIAPIGPMPMV